MFDVFRGFWLNARNPENPVSNKGIKIMQTEEKLVIETENVAKFLIIPAAVFRKYQAVCEQLRPLREAAKPLEAVKAELENQMGLGRETLETTAESLKINKDTGDKIFLIDGNKTPLARPSIWWVKPKPVTGYWSKRI